MLNIIIYIFSYDIWFYISHVLLHKIHFLRTIHKNHHLTNYKTIVFTDAYIGHYLEYPFQSIGIFFPLYFINFYYYEFITVIFLLNIRTMIHHDHRLSFLHHDHHILHHKYPNYNFGEYWIDYFFGTNY